MKNKEVSRREFAKVAALTSAAMLVPAELATQEQKTAPGAAKEDQPQAQGPKLTAESQAEADVSYEMLMRKYGSRFSEEQKREIKRLIYQQQSGLDKLRAFQLSNSDEPATVFRPLVPEVKR
jgi:hypothetical protein